MRLDVSEREAWPGDGALSSGLPREAMFHDARGKRVGAGRIGRGREQFSYRITKDRRVLVWWHGRNGTREIVLKGSRAHGLIAELARMDREQEQLALARATGNFKRGNERQ